MRFSERTVLVNNAAACNADNLVAMSKEAWDRDILVCLSGVFLCCRRVLPPGIDDWKKHLNCLKIKEVVSPRADWRAPGRGQRRSLFGF